MRLGTANTAIYRLPLEAVGFFYQYKLSNRLVA